MFKVWVGIWKLLTNRRASVQKFIDSVDVLDLRFVAGAWGIALVLFSGLGIAYQYPHQMNFLLAVRSMVTMNVIASAIYLFIFPRFFYIMLQTFGIKAERNINKASFVATLVFLVISLLIALSVHPIYNAIESSIDTDTGNEMATNKTEPLKMIWGLIAMCIIAFIYLNSRGMAIAFNVKEREAFIVSLLLSGWLLFFF